MKNSKNSDIKGLLTILVIVVALISAAAFYGNYSQKKKLYDASYDLENDSHYLTLRELGDFKDSQELCNDYDYSTAKKYIESGDVADAYLLLLRLLSYNEYKDASDIVKKLVKDEPLLKTLTLDIGDTFEFGSYEQDGDTTNGPEPIVWIIMDKDDSNIHAISKYVLDVQPFNNSNTSSGASILKWLNTTFRDEAFTDKQQKTISRICILRDTDHGSGDILKSEFTSFALSKNPDKQVYWYEGNSGFNDDDVFEVAYKDLSGESSSGRSDATSKYGVRPSIWLFAEEDELPSEEHYGPRTVTCPWCDGEGGGLVIRQAGTIFEHEEYVVCWKCGGSGHLTEGK